MSKPKIVVVGSSNTDMVVNAERLPQPGETVLGGEFVRAAGGKGANQAVAAARAGAEVTFIACVGDDPFGREALEGFAAEGIRTDHVRVEPGCPSGVALIMVESSGENLIAVAPGANALLSPTDVDAAEDAIASADCLLAQLETPVETVKRALELARQYGVMTILNPAPAQPLHAEVLALVDVLTPNRTEIAELVGLGEERTNPAKAARSLRHIGVGDVIVTLGAEGVLVVSQEEQTVPACRVEPVDTVAAGDVFNGAFAVARTEGKDLVDSACFACAAAAISVTRTGAQPSIPAREEIDGFLGSPPEKLAPGC